LAIAYADNGQFDDAWHCIDEAMATIKITKESLFEAEVNRRGGEIALKSPEPDAAKAEKYFQRALAVARQQQAKSWELRAATSLARLWRSQGKAQQARELLAPVYGWFTEGFDTRDLKEAKMLLDELAAQAIAGCVRVLQFANIVRCDNLGEAGRSKLYPLSTWLLATESPLKPLRRLGRYSLMSVWLFGVLLVALLPAEAEVPAKDDIPAIGEFLTGNLRWRGVVISSGTTRTRTGAPALS
jgi:hypothetical protein